MWVVMRAFVLSTRVVVWMHNENEDEDWTPASAFEQVKSRAGGCEVRSEMQIRETKHFVATPFLTVHCNRKMCGLWT